jgi:hypothetical protein
MKNSEAHDPLKENEFDEKQSGTPDKKSLKEEQENIQTPETQEHESQDPEVENISKSQEEPAPDSPSSTTDQTEDSPSGTTEQPAPQPQDSPSGTTDQTEDSPSSTTDQTEDSPSSTTEQPAPQPQDSPPPKPSSPATPEQEKESSAESEPERRDQSPDEPLKDGAPASKPEGEGEAGKKMRTRVDHGKLIDDEEEQKNNASFDDDVFEDDSEETDTEKEEEERHEEEEERFNFSLLSLQDLVKLMREKLDHPAKGNIRKDVAEIKQAFYDKVHASNEEKKEHFLAEGGNLEDFKPVEDPLEGEMRDLLHKYRELKAEYSRQLENTKLENLKKKQEILEEFRILMEGQERFEVTFRKFKDLQKQWFAAGIVPQQNLKDLWDSYNYFVEKFNDYVRINRELRALDLKKNLELKLQLCDRTEELDKDPNVVQAFRALQKFHTRWREIGPVPRENRDEVWDRFKQATSVINRKHQEYHSRLKESLQENLTRKKELCEQVEAIAAVVYKNHREWIDKTGQVLEIQKTWKTIGYAPKKDNNAIYARFRQACDTFFGNKARFYADAFEEQKDNLKMKIEITEKAEALVKSEDWKETTNELIRLQKQWKEIGPVPRRDSDKLWRRFRKACDTFFNNKSKYYEDIDSTFEDNLKLKEELIKEMERFKPTGKKKEDLDSIEDFQTRFNDIGYVPGTKKDVIKEQFRKVQDQVLQKIGLDDSERSLFRFRNRIMGIMNSPRAQMKLNFERDKLVNKLQQLRSDIGVWENNVGFFKQSAGAEETIQGFHEKIEAAHDRIHNLEEKIRLLDHMENEN